MEKEIISLTLKSKREGVRLGILMLKEAKEFHREDYIKVEAIRPLFPLPFTTEPLPSKIAKNPAAIAALSQPLLEFKLANKKKFRMSGIPTHIAVEIQRILKKKEAEEEEVNQDPRSPLSVLVDKTIEIKRVRITRILSDLGVYLAEIDFKSKTTEKEKLRSMDMIPSHALLAAIRGSKSIYVAKKLLEKTETQTEKEREKERKVREKEKRREEEYYYI